MMRPRKHFGQHFLQDPNVIEHIIRSIAPKPTDALVEIGPGLGALTTHLLPLVTRMDAIEIDRDLIPVLAAQCASLGELNLHEADALTFDLATLAQGKTHLRLVGNLPYNISTPLLFHLLHQIDRIKDMHFMLQKEVAKRLAASPGSKAYGRLSVMAQYYCQIEILFTVNPDAFEPPPKVDSAVVLLTPHKTRTTIANHLPDLENVVRLAFAQRRKTLRNALKTCVSEEQLRTIGIDTQQRAEQLSVEDFVNIANNAVGQ